MLSDLLCWRKEVWNYPAELLQYLKHWIVHHELPQHTQTVPVTRVINQKSTTNSILGKSPWKFCHASRLPVNLSLLKWTGMKQGTCLDLLWSPFTEHSRHHLNHVQGTQNQNYSGVSWSAVLELSNRKQGKCKRWYSFISSIKDCWNGDPLFVCIFYIFYAWGPHPKLWFLSSPEAAVVNKLLPLSLLLTLSSRGEPRAGIFANTDSQETLFMVYQVA